MPYADKKKASEYTQEYAKKMIKRVPLDVQKTYYTDVLKPAADRAGMKVNEFIKEALKEKIEGQGDPSGILLDLPHEELELYAQAADERGMDLQELFREAVKVFLRDY